MQIKDIDKMAVLLFLSRLDGKEATMYPGYPHSVLQAMPGDTPPKLARGVMANLIRRGWVYGCACGCRGDFEITPKGSKQLEAE